ncbi:DUF1573 domain-containing protein [Roseivirga sp. E12]|uniref:DUF1573 domain-containing protein n=1 Tax=Roseivirga sp. E12 TaxID=2819237 RepID=UPI001ABCBF1A|nr:DUF1573 domain-containing protein [Roseivirga sp. E12]MBO3700374.1 DUF1573 domain-containing protein [Roseivirga sp. E12]
MKTKITLLSALACIVMLSSCGNAELEKRVANLERRINQMENGNVVRNTATPTPSAQAIETSVSSGASFQWDKTVHNFGTINQGEVVNFTYKFTNNGTEDLLVQSASASCGCTVPKKPTGPIAPGEQGEIVVRYDSKGKSGQVSPVITIVANTNPRQTRLSLRGFVQVGAVPQP